MSPSDRFRNYSTSNDRPEDIPINTLCWRNISVWKKYPKNRGVLCESSYEDIQLLNDVNGLANSGSLVALMGTSGSGKTTLLASISLRATDGLTGTVYLNGNSISRTRMMKISGFVPQTSLVMDHFTVYEHLCFTALLKMDKRAHEIDRLRRISQLLSQFSLYSCCSTYLHQLSGGERKRLTIATEMLTDPPILFCDEPTSGLDSWNACSVITTLRRFSSRGKIVICSIHQPASGVFDLFDDVLLLATGGRASYFGPVKESAEYFARLQYLCPPSYNMAEFLVNIVSTSAKQDRHHIKVLCDSYASSEQAAKVQHRMHSALRATDNSLKTSYTEALLKLETPTDSIDFDNLFTQSCLLVNRSLKNFQRNYKITTIPFIIYSCIAFFYSSMFARVLYSEEQSRWQNIRGFLSLFILDGCDYPAFAALATADDKLPIREIRAGLYTVEAYYLSVIVCKTAHSAVSAVVFVTIVKNISDCFDYLSYTEIAIISYIFIAAPTALACMLSAIFDDTNISVTILSLYMCASRYVAGVFSNLSGHSGFANAAKYLSIVYYSYQAIMVLEWKTIDEVEMEKFNVTLHDPAAFRYLKIVSDHGFSTYDYKYSLYVLTLFTILCHYIAYLIMSRSIKKASIY